MNTTRSNAQYQPRKTLALDFCLAGLPERELVQVVAYVRDSTRPFDPRTEILIRNLRKQAKPLPFVDTASVRLQDELLETLASSLEFEEDEPVITLQEFQKEAERMGCNPGSHKSRWRDLQAAIREAYADEICCEGGIPFYVDFLKPVAEIAGLEDIGDLRNWGLICSDCYANKHPGLPYLPAKVRFSQSNVYVLKTYRLCYIHLMLLRRERFSFVGDNLKGEVSCQNELGRLASFNGRWSLLHTYPNGATKLASKLNDFLCSLIPD